MLPLPDTVVANRYWAVKLAIYVVLVEGAVMLCICAPPSDHLLNAYRVPLPCGEATLMVWLLPAVQVKFCGAVKVLPSTTMLSPSGLVAMVVGPPAESMSWNVFVACRMPFCQ